MQFIDSIQQALVKLKFLTKGNYKKGVWDNSTKNAMVGAMSRPGIFKDLKGYNMNKINTPPPKIEITGFNWEGNVLKPNKKELKADDLIEENIKDEVDFEDFEEELESYDENNEKSTKSPKKKRSKK